MEPDYGDDLWAGFSDDETGGEIGECESVDGEGGLDLLASMLGDGGEREHDKSAGSKTRKKQKSSQSSTKQNCVKSIGDGPHSHQTESTYTQESDEMKQMRERMEAMEKELVKLRKKVTMKEHCPTPLPPTPSLPTHTQPTTKGMQRIAHQPNSTEAATINALASSRREGGAAGRGGGKAGASLGTGDRSVAERLIKQRKEDKEKNCVTEKYSGLRIKNPLVSSELMKQRMKGRKMVRVPQIASKVKGDDIEGDWVTTGVIVSKVPPKESAKGNRYAIFRLSDLSSQNAVISLFLYGKACQEHWKTSIGSIVAILNPSIMPAKESYSLALSIDHPQRLMLLGVSQDYTTCRATTKSGKKCSNFANASDGGYCDYHTQGAYSKMRSQRMEFQSGYGPSSGKLQEKLFKNSKAELFYYGGQSFAPARSKSRKSSTSVNEEGEMERRMFAPGAKESAARIATELKEKRETVGGRAMEPRLRARGSVVTQEGSETFQRLLSTHGAGAGARMLSKHLQREDTLKQSAEVPEKSASELLTAHKAKLKRSKKVDRKRIGNCSELFNPDCTDGHHEPCTGGIELQENALDEQMSGERVTHRTSEGDGDVIHNHVPHESRELPSSSPPTPRACQPLPSLTSSTGVCSNLPEGKTTSLRTLEQRPKKLQQCNKGSTLPQLGRGLAPGVAFDLDSPSPSSGTASLAKLKAISVLKRNGPIQHHSSSISKGKVLTSAKQSAILRRVEQNREQTDQGNDDVKSCEDSTEYCGREEGPVPAKRRKLDRAEMERIMSAKSSHDWAVKEGEWEREQEYFEGLEKKESLEEKLRKIKELRVSVVQCKQCDYIAEHVGEVCKKEAHRLVRFKAIKRSFECLACKERCFTYNERLAMDPCRRCGGSSFDQCSLYRERKGPKLPSEELLVRGVEQKFLNSLK